MPDGPLYLEARAAARALHPRSRHEDRPSPVEVVATIFVTLALIGVVALVFAMGPPR